jgi:hypothetical protein
MDEKTSVRGKIQQMPLQSRHRWQRRLLDKINGINGME